MKKFLSIILSISISFAAFSQKKYEPKVIFTFKTDGRIYSTPVVTKDSTIVFGSNDKHVYFLGPNGKLKTKFKTGKKIHASPSILKNGHITIGSYDKNLYIFKPDGTLKRTISETSGIFTTVINATKDTLVYAVGKTICFFDQLTGTTTSVLTEKLTHASPVQLMDGTIVIGSNDKFVYFFNPDGTLKTNSKPAAGSCIQHLSNCPIVQLWLALTISICISLILMVH
jgi:outer membrane protein assembly factor BamB